jgi:hypothetical protein
MYRLKNSTWGKIEREKMNKYHLPLERFQIHDPLNIVDDHKS